MEYESNLTYEIPNRLLLESGDLVNYGGHTLEIHEKIGEGGFGSVYKTTRLSESSDSFLSSNNIFALKLLHLFKTHPKDVDLDKQRFMNEVEVGRLKFPHLVQYFGFGMLKGNPFSLMEYCGSGTLQEWMRKRNSERAILTILKQVALGLDYLHGNDFVHRDIKPENVLFYKEDHVKITDFGIAANLNNRVTQTNFLGKVVNNDMFASMLYSPPEQLNASKYYKQTSPLMDIYSFGVLMYYLIHSGNCPFGGETFFNKKREEFVSRKKKGLLVNPISPPNHFSKKWQMLIEKSIAVNPKDRFQSMKEILSIFNSIHPAKRSGKEQQDGDTLILEITNTKNKLKKKLSIPLLALNHKKYIRLGRNGSLVRDNDIEIKFNQGDDLLVSKRHATVKASKGCFFISDGQPIFTTSKEEKKWTWKRSLNGTYVNGRAVSPGSWKEISPTDIIKVGNYIFQIKYGIL